MTHLAPTPDAPPLSRADLTRRVRRYALVEAAAPAPEAWLQTWAPGLSETAGALDLARPDPLALDLRTTAVQLGRLNRYAGASVEPWSVADHCRLAARIAERVLTAGMSCDRRRWRIVAECLLHDVPEVATGDVPAPTLRRLDALIPGFRAVYAEHLHEPILRAVRVACGLPAALHVDDAAVVQLADMTARALEVQHLLPEPPRPWRPLPDPPALRDLGITGALRATPGADRAADGWLVALHDALGMAGARPLRDIPDPEHRRAEAQRLMGA